MKCRFQLGVLLFAAVITPGFGDERHPIEVIRDIGLGSGPGEIAGNDYQMAAAAVYAAGDDRLFVSDYQNGRINCYRMNGSFVREYRDESYRFAYLQNFIVHDGYLVVFMGTQILFFNADTLEFTLSVPVPYPNPTFDHTFDPQTDVAFVRNLMICKMYVGVLGVRMDRIQGPPGLRCTLVDYPKINAMIAGWNSQGADVRLDDEMRVYVKGRIVTRDLSEFYDYLARTIGSDRLNTEYGWSRWNMVGWVRGYYFGQDGLGNTYWTSGGAIIITRGDALIDVTDEISGYGYSSPAVTAAGDVYFIGTVSAENPVPVTGVPGLKEIYPIVGYRLLRIQNTWDPKSRR